MELRQLTAFVAVAEELNFTRAAERLHVVQSGVSAAVRSLERELGVRLFDRTSQRVALTDAGRALLPEARNTLDAARAATQAVGDVRGGLRGTLTVGTLSAIGAIFDLAGLLGRFRAEHPGVDVRLQVSPQGSTGLVKGLVDGALDLAFLAPSGPVPPRLEVRPLVVAPLDLVVPEGHPLTAAGRVTLDLLTEEPFIDFPLGWGNRAAVDRAFAAAGLRRTVAFEVADTSMATDFVRAGLGVTFLPPLWHPDKPGLAALRVQGADLSWTMALGMSAARRASAAARRFTALVDAYVRYPESR